MRRLVQLAALGLVAAAVGGSAGRAQDSTPAKDRIVGSWKAVERFNGQPRVVIALEKRESKIGGTVVMLGVTDDDNNQTTLNLVIDEAALDGDSLSFKTKFPDESVCEWAMSFSGGDQAAAGIVVDGDGPVSDPQKWEMRRDPAR
jgi:hypothetical protein